MSFYQRNEKHASKTPLADAQCENCNRVRPLVGRVTLGIQQIDVTIRRGVVRLQHSWSPDEAGGVVSPHDLRELQPQIQLEWSIAAIDRQLDSLNRLFQLSDPQSFRSSLQQGQTGSEHGTPFLNWQSRSTTPRAEWRQSDFSQPLSSDAVHNFSDTGSLQSGIEVSQPPNRMLPSLPSLSSSFVSRGAHAGSPSLLHSPDPSTSDVQIQYLRREISAKSFALQNLQRDYDNLLANVTLQQQNSRHFSAGASGGTTNPDLSSLIEEKTELQKQVKDLQAQVDDLIKTQEEAHKESIASRNQYMQIMSMSSRLQTQTAADVKRWQAEKEEWERQRLSLLRTIQRLERQGGRIGDDGDGQGDGAVNRLLRGDIEKLEQSCRSMEKRMRELDEETVQLDEALRRALHISTTLRTKVEQARSQTVMEQEMNS